MLPTLTTPGGLAFLALVCALALAKGGPPERVAGLLVATGWLGLSIYRAATFEKLPQTALLLSDFGVALGFLGLAIRYASLWLGAAMLIQGVTFAAHLIHLTEPAGHDRWYALTVNLLGATVLTVIGGASLAAWRARILARRGAVSDP